MAKKKKSKSKPTKKDQALQEYIEYLQNEGKIKKSFTEKLNSYIEDSFTEINSQSAMDLIEKCGKGPSTGYVDGVQYKKDNQRVNRNGINPEAKKGELEQKHLDYQTSLSTREVSRDVMRVLDKCMEYPEDMVGYGLLGTDYDTPNVDEGDMGGYGWGGNYEYDTGGFTDELEDAHYYFQREMNNAPPLQDNVMLFTRDIPNPDLQEGDVFELDTYLGVNFKKGMMGEYDPQWDNIDIPGIRATGGTGYGGRNMYYDFKDKSGYTGDSYEVTVLGSEGTPLLMEDPYISYSHIDTHNAILNKGQKVRLVRVNHEKHTAIYQTVDG